MSNSTVVKILFCTFLSSTLAPGTGKTYLGVRIAEMLLHNRSVWCPLLDQSTPILMICQTNHALDQFLELIKNRLNITSGIIRVGSRCKNEAIKSFSLADARKSVRNNRSIPRDIYFRKNALHEKKTKCDENLQWENFQMEQSRTDILLISLFVEYDIIDREHLLSLHTFCEEDLPEKAIFDWLGLDYNSRDLALKEFVPIKNLNQKTNTNRAQQNEEEEEERRQDEIELYDEYFVTSKTANLRTTTSTQRSSVNKNGYKWHVGPKKPCNRQQLIKSIIEFPTTLTDETVKQLPNNLWRFTTSQRYDLYRYWLLKYQNHCHASIRTARQEYNQAIAELAKYYQEEDYYILKDSVIVAMTTTCAAKYHTVLERLQSKIVIVEEAAAIFEAHIITALSSKCEHLILIGDHIQLRPNPSVYRLGVDYHIDVSLFERFVRNKFPSVRLNIQHRMRPEIARLMKHFYDDLEDHESVLTRRPKINGVENSVFFIDHNHKETDTADGGSKRNEYEARYIIEFAIYLIKQGYRSNQITVLVMYLGQRQYIANLVKSVELLRGLRVMVTDNYQGEENDIILLSLVRSNAEKRIGFLATHNRICVALSRARCGLFVIGNMNLLAETGDMWRNIVRSLDERNEVGRGLSLSCREHAEEKFIADTPESFAKRPKGGCNKRCTSRLKCGHQCGLTCHNVDVEHVKIVCRKKCNEILPCGHQCAKFCHHSNPTQHDPCRIPVEKIIPECGHKITRRCAETPNVHDCEQLVWKRLVCDHDVELACRIASSENELKRFSCPIPCNATLACEHKCKGTCGQCRSNRLHIPCQEKCTRAFICSHVCKAPCTANCPPCTRKCQTFCVHSKCEERCCDPCAPCKEPCKYRCKHLQCTRLCSERCNRGPCNEPCNKKLRCGHDCIGMCGEPCPRQCRICHKSVVQDIFFGTEDEPDARFIRLPDCGHLIEVTGLDRFILDPMNKPTDSTSIHFPECPRCKRPIRQCMRYMPVINQVHDLIEQVKKKILGNRFGQEIQEQRNRVIREYENTRGNLDPIEYSRIKTLFSGLDSGSFISHEMLTLMENILIFINTIIALLNSGKEKLPIDVFNDQISVPLMHIRKYILAHQAYRNFAEQQIQDLQSEFELIRCVIVFESFIVSIKQLRSMTDLKQNETDSIEVIRRLLRKSGRFTESMKNEFYTQMENIKHLGHIPGLGINEHERKAIVSALHMRKGHWYVCPKGHPYVITECGGASQESDCPECGERIGGQRHQLLPTNRHCGAMDDSIYSAWSDEANANMVPQI